MSRSPFSGTRSGTLRSILSACRGWSRLSPATDWYQPFCRAVGVPPPATTSRVKLKVPVMRVSEKDATSIDPPPRLSPIQNSEEPAYCSTVNGFSQPIASRSGSGSVGIGYSEIQA